MGRKRRTRCRHCGELFRADARNHGRQKYCAKPQCRRAGKAARQRRWLDQPQNRDYFRGPQNAARARAWQRAHPHYWKQHRRIKQRVLQDAWSAQASDLPEQSVSLALQDVCRAQAPVLIGLIAHLSDSLLQEDIATASRRLLQRGRDLLGSRGAKR